MPNPVGREPPSSLVWGLSHFDLLKVLRPLLLPCQYLQVPSSHLPTRLPLQRSAFPVVSPGHGSQSSLTFGSYCPGQHLPSPTPSAGLSEPHPIPCIDYWPSQPQTLKPGSEALAIPAKALTQGFGLWKRSQVLERNGLLKPHHVNPIPVEVSGHRQGPRCDRARPSRGMTLSESLTGAQGIQPLLHHNGCIMGSSLGLNLHIFLIYRLLRISSIKIWQEWSAYQYKQASEIMQVGFQTTK